jgi:hypothetical protein
MEFALPFRFTERSFNFYDYTDLQSNNPVLKLDYAISAKKPISEFQASKQAVSYAIRIANFSPSSSGISCPSRIACAIQRLYTYLVSLMNSKKSICISSRIPILTVSANV